MPAWLVWGLLAVATSQALAQTHVVSITPSPNALNQPAAASVVVQFDNPIDPATVTANSFLVAGSGPHPGSFAFALGDKQITFTPGAPFAKGETVLVNLSTQLKDAAHNAIAPWASQFTVVTVPNAGKFAQGVRYPVGEHPTSLVAYDVNEDGKLDLVVANGGYGGATQFKGISVLLGNGDGTFQPRIGYPTATGNAQGAVSVAMADVNHDGHGDAIVANYGDNSVAVLLGDGLGGFGPPVTYHLAEYPWVVRVADLDGDGNMDIIVSLEGLSGIGGNGVQILWGNANGTFTVTVPINSNTTGHFGLAIGDVNGDGLLDIISTDWQGNFWVLVNAGGRTFAPGVSYSTGGLSRGVTLADFNGDGKLDVAVACQGYYGSPPPNYTGVATIYLGDGLGNFNQRVDYPVNGLTDDVTAGDFNGDGRPDIATANLYKGNPYTAQSVSAWKNSGAGAFAIREDLNTGGDNPWAIVAADFNGDGRLDLATVNWHQYTSGGDVSVLMNVSANVSGLVYLDLDENCTQNGPDEVPVGGRLVRLTDNTGVSRYEVSQMDGTFNSVLPTGSYTVNMVHSATSEETCNDGLGVTYNITVAQGAPVTGLVFGVKQKCAASVTCVSWIGWPCPPNPPSPPCTHSEDHLRNLCPCEPFQYAVTVHNTGTSTLLAGSVIRLQLDPNVKFISFPASSSSCSPAAGSLATPGVPDPNPPCNPSSGGPNTGQLVQWTLNIALPAAGSCTFYVNVQVANVPLGTLVCSTPSLIAFCNPGPMPSTITSLGCCDTVRCSEDPNDKRVSPTGCGPLGNVAPGTPLTYRVQFQNLGNAPASRVLVRDVLDPALDPATLQILFTKHTLTSFQILPGQEMIWTFDNINLPAAVSDEMGSRGEFVYSVLPKPSASVGTTILNTAAIYFDQNQAVNTAITTNTLRSQPVPDAAFTAQHSPTDAGLLYNFTYTGNTPDGAVFTWDFGPDATPPTSTDRNPVGIRFATAGPKTVTLTLNRYGCSASASRTVQAVFIPLLTCPGSLSLSTTNSAGSVVTFDVTASGGCDTNIVVQCSPPSGSLFPVGLTLVTCTAVDGCGTSNQCSFVVEVKLLQIHLSCPPTIRAETASPAGTNVSFQVGAFSDCSPTNVVLDCSPPSGSLFPMGQTTVNCTAWDSCGLTNTCSFVVEVLPPGELPVRLKITRAGDSCLLSWPDPSTGFRLQSADRLVPPNWTDVALPVVVTNGEKTVALPLPLGSIQFYRLIEP